MSDVRANSATSFAIEDCPRKYTAETYLKELSEEAKQRLDRGNRAHQAFAGVNALLKATGHCSAEDCQRLAGAVGLGLHDTAKLADGLTWYATKFDGARPFAVEEDGGRWEFLAGGVIWKGKTDAKIMTEEGLTVIEGKWGWIPWDKEDAKWLIQNLIYAKQEMELNQVGRLTVLMVSLTGKRTVAIEYTEADVAMYRPYLDKAGEHVNALHQKIAAETSERGLRALLETDEFAPSLCGWCPGCSVRVSCRVYSRVLSDPLSVVGTDNKAEAHEKLKLVDRVLSAAKKAIKEELLVNAEIAGSAGYVEGEYRVRIKPVHKDAYTVAEHEESWLVVEAPGKWSKEESAPIVKKVKKVKA